MLVREQKEGSGYVCAEKHKNRITSYNVCYTKLLRTQDFAQEVSDCDAVFDTVGGEVAKRSFSVLRPGGRAAFIASGASAPSSPRPDVVSLRPKVGRDRPHLERILALVAAGTLRPPEITLYPLSQAAAAHAVSRNNFV